ncbi:UDP-glucose dehydrogenase family protein [Devosia albogilva]|uniref:UDP-glucose 6-dehydrogenase n=1 Tax=Devosia albogilva TaxID=429726 RepID=A0ABW5QKU3_9HYPH
MPRNEREGAADLTHVIAVARSIGTHINGFKIVIEKSTVPVGTGDLLARTISETMAVHGLSHDFEVCSNPEFLKEGSAIADFADAPRIVVGAGSDRVRQAMRDCYQPYLRDRDRLVFMDVRAAELTKYAANAMLATKISFINEVANLAERLGVDVEQVRTGIASDPRIGPHFIQPGAGYGGSCFPKDVRALVRAGRDAGYEPQLLAAVNDVNIRQQNTLFDKLHDAFAGDLAGRTFAVWGLAFKPNTDDMREAPSRRLLEALWEHGALVRAYDPEAMREVRRLYGYRADLELCESPESALECADALIVCTEWPCFAAADPSKLAEALAFPIVVDGRNMFDPAMMQQHKLLYYAAGRGSSVADSSQLKALTAAPAAHILAAE